MAERAKKLTSKFFAIAANRLGDGITVWAHKSSAGYEWVEQWADVQPVELDALDALEAWTDAEAARDQVISHRVIEVDALCAGFQPRRLREQICTAGPTFRLDLGKQAALAAH